jgi:hypothetical protein
MLDRETTLDLTRLLNELVVSGDRMGSTHHGNHERLAAEWLKYCQEIDLWRRAATLRGSAFDALWPDARPEEDERIEAELAPRY